MANEQIDSIISRMPLMDGSGRRRFIVGFIVIFGLAIIFRAYDLGQWVPADWTEIIKQPSVLIVAVLLVYTVGSVIDLLSELFLIRAASGVFWAIRFPLRQYRYSQESSIAATPIAYWSIVTLQQISALMLVPVLVLWHMIRGLRGKSDYSLDLCSLLSDEGNQLLEGLPTRVRDGLTRPVGDKFDLAVRMLILRLNSEQDKTWAKNLIVRAKDVAATTTALLVVLVVASAFFISNLPDADSSDTQNIGDGLDELGFDSFDVYYDSAYLIPQRVTTELKEKLLVRYLIRLYQEVSKKNNPASVPNSKKIIATLVEIRKLNPKIYKKLVLPDIEATAVGKAGEQARLKLIETLDARQLLDSVAEFAQDRSDDSAQQKSYDGSLEDRRSRKRILALDIETNTDNWAAIVPGLNESRITTIEETLAAIKKHDDAVNERREIIAFSLALPPVFLVLYLGFFSSLRTAIVSIVDAAGLQQEDVRTEAPEDR